jgi:hypothetical protein
VAAAGEIGELGSGADNGAAVANVGDLPSLTRSSDRPRRRGGAIAWAPPGMNGGGTPCHSVENEEIRPRYFNPCSAGVDQSSVAEYLSILFHHNPLQSLTYQNCLAIRDSSKC